MPRWHQGGPDPRLAKTEATPTSAWNSLEKLVKPGFGYLPHAFDQGLDELCVAIGKATRSEESWQAKIEAGAAALLSFLEASGDWARLVALEAPLSGTATAECTEKLHGALLPVLEQARESVIVGAQIKPPSRLIAELVVLGSLSLIRAEMLSAEERSLAELCPALCAEILEPYLSRAAQRLDHPGSAGVPQRAEMVPLRPHPRTVPALSVIASAPGLNTKQVGRAVGIENSGHIASILRRFQERGLIENAASRPARRGERAWLLTPYGQRILEILTSSFNRARWLDQSELSQVSA
jgi:hypothetical protein